MFNKNITTLTQWLLWTMLKKKTKQKTPVLSSFVTTICKIPLKTKRIKNSHYWVTQAEKMCDSLQQILLIFWSILLFVG